jgi:ABC-type antimicrobial peptide transport system permease subunit
VIGQGVALGIAGAVLGVSMGIGLARLMLAVRGRSGRGLLQRRVDQLALDPLGMALYAASGVLAGVAGALQPAWAWRRIEPARAQRRPGDRGPASPAHRAWPPGAWGRCC